jgi:hypothetical protein
LQEVKDKHATNESDRLAGKGIRLSAGQKDALSLREVKQQSNPFCSYTFNCHQERGLKVATT